MHGLSPYRPGHGPAVDSTLLDSTPPQRATIDESGQPAQVTLDRVRTPTGTEDGLWIRLTTGCHWSQPDGCPVCGTHSPTSRAVRPEEVLAQLDRAIAYESERRDDSAPVVVLLTAGAAFDATTLPVSLCQQIRELFADRDRLIVDVDSAAVTPARLDALTPPNGHLDLAIGIDTTTDRLRTTALNTDRRFESVATAATVAAARGAGIRATVLLKPPFLTESEAITDTVSSVYTCSALPGCHTVSIVPPAVDRHPLLTAQATQAGYRPPWLWSLLAVLKRTTDADAVCTSTPVVSESDHQPRNCGECDDRVRRAVVDFSLRGDPAVFAQVDCSCRQTWQTVCERERAYTSPLVP